MNRISVLLALLVGIVIGSSSTWVHSAALYLGPDPKVPELGVLDSFVGEWKGDFAGRGSEQRTQMVGDSQWVLNGRFLLTKNRIIGGDQSESWTIWTYDTRDHQYRRWVFTSSGLVMSQRGSWNDTTKEFVFTVDKEPAFNGTITATTKIVDDRTRAWSYLFKDQAGKETGEIKGTNTRVEK